MRKWNKIKNERGAALVLVLVVVALLSIVGVTFSNQIANRIKSTKTTNEVIQAKYLAETCVENSVDKAYEKLYDELEKIDNEFKKDNNKENKVTSRTVANEDKEENLEEIQLNYMNNIKYYLATACKELEKARDELIEVEKLGIMQDGDANMVYSSIDSNKKFILALGEKYNTGDISNITRQKLESDIDNMVNYESKLLGNDMMFKFFLEDGNVEKDEHIDNAFIHTYKALDKISLAIQNMNEYRHTIFHRNSSKVEVLDEIPNQTQYLELIQRDLIDRNWSKCWDELNKYIEEIPNRSKELNDLRTKLFDNVQKFEVLSLNISKGEKNTSENYVQYKNLLYEIIEQFNKIKIEMYRELPSNFDAFGLSETLKQLQRETLTEIKCRIKELKPQEVAKTEDISLKIPFYKAEYDATKEDWLNLIENGYSTEMKFTVTGDKNGITEIEPEKIEKIIPGLGEEVNSNSKYKVQAIVNFKIKKNESDNDNIKDIISISHDISSYKKIN